MVKCDICNKSVTYFNRLKNGYICNDCVNSLPKSILQHIKEIKSSNIRKVKKIIFTLGRDFYWFQYDNFKIYDKNYIGLNKWGIYIKDIRNISYNVYPIYKQGKRVLAYVTLVIETRKPHIKIEEPISEHYYSIDYFIKNKKIVYSLPKQLESVVRQLNKCVINNISADTVRDMFPNSTFYYDREKVFREEAARERKRQESEYYDWKRKTFEREKQRKKTQNKQNERTKTNNNSELEKALNCYKISQPFTMKELKKQRNLLLKKYHPDSGGTEEQCRIIYQMFDILKVYAKS